MTRYIEKDFVFKKMVRWLAASVAMGLILSAAYWWYFNMKYSDLSQQYVEPDERLLISNYDGNYMSYPETTRCAVWEIKVKEDIMDDLSRDPSFNYKNYLHQYGDALVARLNSLWGRQTVYEGIKDDPEIGIYDISPYDINNIYGGAFLHSENTLGINVTAPLSYQVTYGLSNKELVYIRDKVFDVYTALLDDDTYYADLPIELVRQSSQIGDSLSERKLIREVLQEPAPAVNNSFQFPKKRLLICFALGFVFVESIVFLFAARNDHVKSVQELTHRTDLVLLDVVSKAEMDSFYQEHHGQCNSEYKGSAYLYNSFCSEELTAKVLTFIREKYALKNVEVIEKGASILPQEVPDGGCRLIIPVTLMKTTYNDLEKIAEEINPCGMEVQAVVIHE